MKLKNTEASATMQSDGSVQCNHEELSAVRECMSILCFGRIEHSIELLIVYRPIATIIY